ncbi:MAG: hypothetical protein LBH69_00795 [Methanomassiliicoccaceae archaeon]|jgi:hypothetical protein|nr:hypothetical protein [Methanomassiliicoccaceae archaeon]
MEFIKRNAHISELSMVRRVDKVMLYTFLALLVLCGAVFFALIYTDTMELAGALPIISVPFLIVGLATYVHEKMWKALVVAIAAPAALFFIGLPLLVIFFVAFLLVGCVGVVSVAATLQRFVFFAVISSVEYINIKDKLSLWDRLVLFAFNIPPNIDTRKVTMDYNLKRSGIPFREMLETMFFAFLVGVALWIYISMNPAFMYDVKLYEAPIFVFSLIMFIPLLVLPWTPFKSLNVRITTSYRDFSLYSGAVETLRKMAIPVFAVAVFILVASTRIDIQVELMFIVASVVFNLIVVAASSIIFYLFFESAFVDDAVTKWKLFRPIPITAELDRGEAQEDDRGMPERDTSDLGEI